MSTVWQLGLVGHPLGHSLSPLIHHYLLQACGAQGHYTLWPSPVFEDWRNAMEALPPTQQPHGANVTIPHKLTAAQACQQLSPMAQRLGAVNTLRRLPTGGWWGHNTDVGGFWQSLEAPARQAASQHPVLVLGAGGSCRAVLAALLWEAATPPPSITLAVRDVAKAAPLHQELSTWCQSLPQPPQAHCVPLAALDETVLSTVGLVVNTTPVGMWPHAEACPLTPAQLAALPPHAVVVDLIYKPAQTALLAQAAARGLATQNGLGMLIHQAIEAFACWLQLSPSATQRTTWASALQLQLGQQLALAMQQPNAPNR